MTTDAAYMQDNMGIANKFRGVDGRRMIAVADDRGGGDAGKGEHWIHRHRKMETATVAEMRDGRQKRRGQGRTVVGGQYFFLPWC